MLQLGKQTLRGAGMRIFELGTRENARSTGLLDTFFARAPPVRCFCSFSFFLFLKFTEDVLSLPEDFLTMLSRRENAIFVLYRKTANKSLLMKRVSLLLFDQVLHENLFCFFSILYLLFLLFFLFRDFY